MLLVQRESFIKPYAQEHLNGEEGLTSLDIAKALGAEHRDVKSSIRRFSQEDRTCATVTAKVQTGGRPVEIIFMRTIDAKMFVATYQNAVGRAYLRFLLACERIVLESMPQLLAENKEMKLKLAKYERPKVSTIDVPVMVNGLWGKTEGPKRRKARKDEVSPIVQMHYKVNHSARTITGCSKSIQKTNEQIQEEASRLAIKAADTVRTLLD
jgi:hypothetical protein